MKEFIEFIAKHLVDSPDSVKVEENETNEKTVELTLKVGPDDVGKVIGKQGKTAQAMRTLLTAIAAKDGKRAILKILDQYLNVGKLSEFFLIAKIIAVYNSEGYVTVKSYSDFPERFFVLNKIFIDVFNEKREFFVEDVVEFGDNFIFKFKNFNSKDDVEFLVGSSLFVQEEDVIELKEDTYFIHDLIGCKVFFSSKFFGKIKDVLSLSSNDVYVVEDNNGRELMIPAIKEYIKSVDIDNKKVYLKQDVNYLFDDEN